MNTLIKKAVIYKMAILMGVLFSLNALFTAIVISFMNTDWSTLSSTSKFLLICGILQNWTGTLIAFFNKTISRIEQGQFPVDTGDTNARAFVKTTTETSVQQQTAEIKP